MANKNRFSVLILAAGAGTRMKSSLPKVLHPVCGVPMVLRVMETASAVRPSSVGVIVGHGARQVAAALGKRRGVSMIVQKSRKGSGHAVRCASRWLARSGHGDVLVLAGDAPLIRSGTLARLRERHIADGNSATVLSALTDRPFGYGRILPDAPGRVSRIIEEKDASPEEREIREINSGVYFFRVRDLLEVLPRLGNRNAKKEYYLTDAIGLLNALGRRVGVHRLEDRGEEEILGINSRADLAAAEEIIGDRIKRKWMESGVTIRNPGTVTIAEDVRIEPDAVILPGTILLGRTRLGRGCRVGPYACVEDSDIGAGTEVRASFLYGVKVLPGAKIGPYAHLRPGSRVGRNARIGNFTEVKNSDIGDETKVSHLSYVGDSRFGSRVNVGAGAITCNFDGKRKFRTVVGSGSFIGSNVNLVAPVAIGAGAVVGAGSTITRNVPANALALERTGQVIKPGWTKKRER